MYRNAVAPRHATPTVSEHSGPRRKAEAKSHRSSSRAAAIAEALLEPATWTEPGDLAALVHLGDATQVAAPRVTIAAGDLLATNQRLAGLPIWTYAGTLGPSPRKA